MEYEDLYLVPLEQIKSEILGRDIKNVCRHISAAGMQSDDIKSIFTLIFLCIKDPKEWIRNAGYICLYYLHDRYRKESDANLILELVKNGLTDHSDLRRV